MRRSRPVENGTRNIWVTETGLSTALNISFMASLVSLFGVVVGVAHAAHRRRLRRPRRWGVAEARESNGAGGAYPGAVTVSESAGGNLRGRQGERHARAAVR